MRHLLLATGLTLLAIPATASASHNGSAGGGRDFAAGSAKNMLIEVTPFAADLRVSAHAFDAELAEPLGLFASSDVNGHVVGSGTLPNGEFKTQGEVTCLKVVGNQATIKYRFAKRQGSAAPPAGGVQVFIEDNGGTGDPDGNASDPPQPAALFEQQADQCEFPRGPFNPVDSGNYVVHDADPAPLPMP